MAMIVCLFVCVSVYLCAHVGMYVGKSEDKEVVRMDEKVDRKKLLLCSGDCVRTFRPCDF